MVRNLWLVFWAALASQLIENVASQSQKKGVCLGHLRCGDFGALRGVHWWYNWGLSFSHADNCSSHPLTGYVPMVWGTPSSAQLANIPADAHFLLGFNEPNHRGQANLTPEEAARHWHELQQHAGHKVLVSPAAAPCGDPNKCLGDTTEWFDKFFHACSGCKVDYLATHGYYCDPNALMHFLDTLHTRYHKPIWLTEFSCPHKASVAEQLTYMKAVLPRLEAAPYVYRYAWFSARFAGTGFVPSEVSLLHQDSSTLTELGRFYVGF